MKQAFIKKGQVMAVNVPSPTVKSGCLKIKVHFSAISAGTEMTSVKGSGKSIIARAIEDPTKVLRVFEILKTQGLKSAKNKIDSATDKYNPMGYSVSGEVIEVGEGVSNFKVGDFVSAGGSGFAYHAEEVIVPKNLVVKVPEGMDMAHASTGTIGSIALHGVRRADLRMGEYAVVFGAGLLGLITTQMLIASGVRVACVDINDERLSLAKQLGASLVINGTSEDPVLAVKNWTNGYGADAVLFLASTSADEPLSQAFRMCRRKGRVVMVGVSGMNINREDIYKYEIDFMISSSYGPGRYDDSYELDGVDYPYAFVRWTENRNIAEYLNMVHEGKINLARLSPKLYPINDVGTAYENLSQNPTENILSVIQYDVRVSEESSKVFVNEGKQHTGGKIAIGLIGAGNFAVSTLLPIIFELNDKYYLKSVVNSSGDKALNVANQFQAQFASSNTDDIFNDPEIDLVMICTRHSNHAQLVMQGLKANKHVFVEKPLCTTLDELHTIEAFYAGNPGETKPIVTVGFNRRYSQHAVELKKQLANRQSPVFLQYRMNAGFIPYDSWVHADGGRIVGESCHIIDLFSYLTDSEIVEVTTSSFNPVSGKFKNDDNKTISLSFKDGSVGVINYFSCGSPALNKEYLEAHFDNKSVILDDYRTLTGFGIKIKSPTFSLPQKGHKEEWVSLYNAIKKGEFPISLTHLFDTTRASILADQA